MRPGTLIREAAASAWASKVPTILILLVTAAMCFTASAISGRNAALQQQLDQRTQDAGARVITISDLGNDGFLTGTAIETLTTLSTVDTAAAVVPRQVVGRISSLSKLGMVGSARPRWTSRGRFQAIASWGRTSLYSVR